MQRIRFLFAAAILFTGTCNGISAQTADQIIDQYAKALSPNGVALTTISLDMRVETMGMVITGNMKLKRPNMSRSETTMAGETSVTVSDGQTAWLAEGGSVTEIPVEDAEESSLDALGNYVEEYKAEGYTFSYAGTTPGGHKLKAEREMGEASYFYFDGTTHLLAKIEPESLDGITVLTDYRNMGGIMIPHTFSVTGPEGSMSIVFTNTKVNQDIPDSTFGKPN
jgi:outer membrane lipoprotein-sorting protein